MTVPAETGSITPGQIEEASRFLHDVSTWKATAEHWDIVERVLEQLEAALAVDSARAMRDALINLEMVATTRYTPISGEAKNAPEPVRERVNRTVDRIGNDKSSSKDEKDGDDGGKRR